MEGNTTAAAVLATIDLAHLVDRLTGRDGGLRPSKPNAAGDTGLVKFVWRMARFHAGHDSSMPITAHWDLQDYLDEEGIEASVSGILDEDGKAVLAALDEVVDEVLEEFGESPTAGAERWQRAGAF